MWHARRGELECEGGAARGQQGRQGWRERGAVGQQPAEKRRGGAGACAQAEAALLRGVAPHGEAETEGSGDERGWRPTAGERCAWGNGQGIGGDAAMAGREAPCHNAQGARMVHSAWEWHEAARPAKRSCRCLLQVRSGPRWLLHGSSSSGSGSNLSGGSASCRRRRRNQRQRQQRQGV